MFSSVQQVSHRRLPFLYAVWPFLAAYGLVWGGISQRLATIWDRPEQAPRLARQLAPLHYQTIDGFPGRRCLAQGVRQLCIAAGSDPMEAPVLPNTDSGTSGVLFRVHLAGTTPDVCQNSYAAVFYIDG